MQPNLLPISYGKPSRKQQGEQLPPPIRSHQTTRNCSFSHNPCRNEYIISSTSSAVFVSILQEARKGRRVFRRGRGPGPSGISGDQRFSFSGSFQPRSKRLVWKQSVLL